MVKNSKFIKPICLFDSGIGGISVLCALKKAFPSERFIYMSSTKNMPFGNKSKNELLSIGKRAVNTLLKYNPKCIVFACNTLSIVALKTLQKEYKIKIFGITPPIEKNDNLKSLVIATNTSIKYLHKIKNCTYLPLQNFALDIQNNALNLEMVNLTNHLPSHFENYDQVILGCTHYFLERIGIEKHFYPLKVIDGLNDLVLKMSVWLNMQKNTNHLKSGAVLFVGDEKLINKQVFRNIF